LDDRTFREFLDRVVGFLSRLWHIGVGRRLTPAECRELRDRLEQFFSPRR
jgi:hypothetical protein